MLESTLTLYARVDFIPKSGTLDFASGVYLSEALQPLLGFCLGWCSNFVGSESGRIQSVKLKQNMVSNRTRHNLSQSHTVCIYCTLITGKGWGGRCTREKVRKAIVHKAGSKVPTWLTVSSVYSINSNKHLPQVNFFRWQVNFSDDDI